MINGNTYNVHNFWNWMPNVKYTYFLSHSLIYNLDLFNVARKRVLCRCNNKLARFDLAYFTGSQDLVGAIEDLLDIASDDSAYSSVAKQYIAVKIEGKPYEDELKRILGIIRETDTTIDRENELATAAVGQGTQLMR